MGTLNWNFFEIAENLGLPTGNTAEVPEGSGFYMLFSEEGSFIYVGKADDLKSRMACHFSDNEENERIRALARHAIWFPTKTVSEAEIAEGELFDFWVNETGMHPIANKVKPPASRITEEKMLSAKLRVLFNTASSLAKRFPR